MFRPELSLLQLLCILTNECMLAHTFEWYKMINALKSSKSTFLLCTQEVHVEKSLLASTREQLPNAG